jgi:ubiquinone/menaquinone biosynthesis C-methylase UbiE
MPAKFTAIDVDEHFLKATGEKLDCPYEFIKIEKDAKSVLLPDESVDLIISFYSREHPHPLRDNLSEYSRVLKPHGKK